MNFLTIIGAAFPVVLAYVTVIWLLSLPKKDASIVGISWGLGFVQIKSQYREYVENTSAFSPLPPRRKKS
ncbi:MAG: hypothetical protein EHM81_05475 [Chloroflexi bacterium]|nr:MAG: hypothetical protein EHM81_05475 [Chloroflexota bacterium]